MEKFSETIKELSKKRFIQNSSCKLLKFFVRDLLDFQAISNKKMKKDIEYFDVRDAIREIIDV